MKRSGVKNIVFIFVLLCPLSSFAASITCQRPTTLEIAWQEIKNNISMTTLGYIGLVPEPPVITYTLSGGGQSITLPANVIGPLVKPRVMGTVNVAWTGESYGAYVHNECTIRGCSSGGALGSPHGIDPIIDAGGRRAYLVVRPNASTIITQYKTVIRGGMEDSGEITFDDGGLIQGDAYSPVTGTYTLTAKISGVANRINDLGGYPAANDAPTTPPYSYNLVLNCAIVPLQLAITASPSINFGIVVVGSSSIFKEFSIKITSGTQIPTGTMTFRSTDTKLNSRINMLGGEVSIRNKTTNNEYYMNSAYPLTSRDMTFVAELNTVGSKPGEALESLTVDILVN